MERQSHFCPRAEICPICGAAPSVQDTMELLRDGLGNPLMSCEEQYRLECFLADMRDAGVVFTTELINDIKLVELSLAAIEKLKRLPHYNVLHTLLGLVMRRREA